jgi:crotonobetainyl-CoA:carnitine CoA-transferase CaiB-like acyl-CoA transferase
VATRRPLSATLSPAARGSATGPLAGVKVVELAHIMAGPVCGLMLADLGADVLKVERLPSGDDARRMAPPSLGGESAAFLMMNRNKRGIALDLRRPEAVAALRRLAAGADVLIENFRRGTMERMGLGYDRLRAENPRLVYCCVSGYGRTGPLADRGGFDLVAQGMSGLMSITGEGPDRPPVKVGAPVTDIGAGILAALGVLAAYAHRLRTGEGQQVDTSLFEAGIVQTYWQSAICLATGVSPGAMGSAHPLNAPYQAFETRDGWVNVGAANQRNWLALVQAIGAPALAADPRFCDNAARMAHLDALGAALAPLFLRHTTAEWLDALDAAGVPAGPVLSIAEVLEHPQTRARDMVPEVEHTRLGRLRTLGLPVKLSATPGSLRRGAPLLGEHTREVLAEHGYAEGEIDALVASGAALDGAEGA